MTLPNGYQYSLPTDPVAFHTMMFQAISTAVAAPMSAYTQATTPPHGGRCGRDGQDDGGMCGRGGRGGDPKQVVFPINCN